MSTLYGNVNNTIIKTLLYFVICENFLIEFNQSSNVCAGFWKGEVQKIWEEQRSESEIVLLKFSPIFSPKSGEEQKKKKKRSSLKFSPIFCPNYVRSKEKNQKVFTQI